MNESIATGETSQSTPPHFIIQDSIFTFALVSFFIWYTQYVWGRRKLYWLSMNVPGPISFPIIGSAYQFFFHITNGTEIFKILLNQCLEYPRLFRIWLGPYLVYLLYTPKDIEKILTSQHNIEKSPFVYDSMSEFVGPGLLSAPGHIWKPNRKIMSPTFNTQILNSFISIFREKSKILVEQIKQIMDKEDTNWYHIITKYTFDAVVETTMGVSMDTQRDEKIKFTSEAIVRLLELWNYRIFNLLYQLPIRPLVWSLSPLKQEAELIRKNYFDFADKIVREKEIKLQEKRLHQKDETYAKTEKDSSSRKRILLEMLLENPKISKEQIRSEVALFIGVGMDTTALAICSVLTCLGVQQEEQQKLYEEVMEVLGPNRDIEVEDLPKLKYTERVIQESLRLYPVGPGFARLLGEDVTLDNGIILPAGSHTILTAFVLHRNPDYWKNPTKFDPDRFLPEEVAKRHPYTYIPFSKGPRNCLGRRYAMLNMKTIVATLMRQYTVCTGYKSLEDIEIELSTLLKFKNGYKLTFKPRKNL